jgi:putative ABC transport system permease protein
MSAWNMAFRSLGRRRLRTGLTVSGITVGVAMMFILLSLASGMENQTTQMIRALGGADITVYNATTPGRGGFGGFFGVARTLNESLTQTIYQISGVYAVSPQLSFTGYVNGTRITLNGIDPTTYSAVTGGLNVVNGVSISENDEIVLGKAVADSLNATVGENITVSTTTSGGHAFTIVGIYETGITFQELAGYISLKDAQNITNQQGLVTQILVKCQDPNFVSSVSDAISSSIPGVRATSPTSMVSQASQILNTLTMFFAVIGLVALFAGSFGVINTMIMSVSERTWEIGTLKAIGARDSEILKIFLTEALLIGLIGGGVGVIAGVALSYAFPMFTRGIFGTFGGTPFGIGGVGFRGFRGGTSLFIIAPAITPLNIAFCFSLGALVGILAGLYPAWRAARMKPVEAFRHV